MTNPFYKKPFEEMTKEEKNMYLNKNSKSPFKMVTEDKKKFYLNSDRIKNGELFKFVAIIKRKNNKIYFIGSEGQSSYGYTRIKPDAGQEDTIGNLYKTMQSLKDFFSMALSLFEQRIIDNKISKNVTNNIKEKFYKEDLLGSYERTTNKGIYLKKNN